VFRIHIVKRLSHWEQHETQGNKTNKGSKAKQQERNANIAARNAGHTQQWTTPSVGSILISILTSITIKVRVFKKHFKKTFKNILDNFEKLQINSFDSVTV
jgi:hypothetical protein